MENASCVTRKQEKSKYKVTYNGDFWNNQGRGAKEIFIGKSFTWGKNQCYVPAIYTCGKGLILDICMEHPLNVDFMPNVKVNGKELQSDQGCSVLWLPLSCLEEGVQNEPEVEEVLVHYGLDIEKTWSIHRYTFLWNTKRIPTLKSLSVKMECRPVFMPAIRFTTSLKEGEKFETALADMTKSATLLSDTIHFCHPITSEEYTLHIQECEQQQFEQAHFYNSEEMEYPTHCMAMSYTLSPDISGLEFCLSDCAEGDRPRLKALKENEFGPISVVMTGIIGGADGPTVVMMSKDQPRVHVACSALYFDEVKDVTWCFAFAVKQVEDMEVGLV